MSRNNEHEILLLREGIQNNKYIRIFKMFYVDVLMMSYRGERTSLKKKEQIIISMNLS
jgi:hypothetical protein